MYPWISHMISHLGGKCNHSCSYCYVQAMESKTKSGKYVGSITLIEKEFEVDYGSGKTIFIEYMNDLFAKDVPDEWIKRIIDHSLDYPKNTYVFQTKNPARFFDFLNRIPKGSIKLAEN